MSRLWPVTRRSAFLMLFGLAYGAVGLSYITGPVTPGLDRSLRLALTVVPLPVWGGLWIACGLVAIVTGLTRWHKPVGFGALTFIGLLWASAFGVAWLAGDSPRGWVTALIFGMVSGAVHIVAGMRDAK